MEKRFLKYSVTTLEDGLPLKNFLLQHQFSSHYLIALRTEDKVTINGTIKPFFTHLESGDEIEVDPYLKKDSLLIPMEYPLDILYEDADYIALNKPFNIATHPTGEQISPSLANGLASYYQKLNLNINIHPLTRLDRITTGVTLFAKHPLAQHLLSPLVEKNALDKTYLALVDQGFPFSRGLIDIPILRPNKPTIQREVSSSGKRSLTKFKTLSKTTKYTLLEIKLLTGRTHQIRVHFAALGFPLIGDFLYGLENPEFLGLHCSSLSFTHFRTGKNILIGAPLPLSFKTFLEES